MEAAKVVMMQFAEFKLLFHSVKLLSLQVVFQDLCVTVA